MAHPPLKFMQFPPPNIRALFNPALIDRVNKLMTDNISSTYNFHMFLESPGQLHQTIYNGNAKG